MEGPRSQCCADLCGLLRQCSSRPQDEFPTRGRGPGAIRHRHGSCRRRDSRRDCGRHQFQRRARSHSVITDRQGQFRMEDLPPGSYRIEARARGFETQSFSAQVMPSQQAVADVMLRVGSAAQTVTIEASPARPSNLVRRHKPGGQTHSRPASVALRVNYRRWRALDQHRRPDLGSRMTCFY